MIFISRLYSVDGRMFNEFKQLVESELAKGTETLGENPRPSVTSFTTNFT
jgi:hypothetical protein